MLFKWIGVLLIAAAGALPAIQYNLHERRRVRITDAYLSLCRFAMYEISLRGATVREILARADTLCRECGAPSGDVKELLQAAENCLPAEGVRAVRQVFEVTAVTRNEQQEHCQSAVQALELILAQRRKELKGKLRTGAILPLSAAAIALLLLW